MKRKGFGLVLSTGLLCFGCGRADPIPAAYCAVVAAHHTDDRRDDLKLLSLITKFSGQNGFKAVDPANISSVDFTNSSKDILLSVTFGMGDFGAVVTLFYLGKNGNDIRRLLHRFVMKDVNSVYRVRLCKDIPGFENPTMSDQFK